VNRGPYVAQACFNINFRNVFQSFFQFLVALVGGSSSNEGYLTICMPKTLPREPMDQFVMITFPWRQ